jgi:hypothetical protein
MGDIEAGRAVTLPAITAKGIGVAVLHRIASVIGICDKVSMEGIHQAAAAIHCVPIQNCGHSELPQV